VARWLKGEQTVMYMIDRGRLESFEASDLTALADAQIRRATLRLTATAISALERAMSMVPTLPPTTLTEWPPRLSWGARAYGRLAVTARTCP
jgi:hypothetical protein